MSTMSPPAFSFNGLREPAFDGFDAPVRCEAEVFDCIVEGKVPKEIDGTFYRVAPDPQVAPRYPGEVNFNGDGMISAFRFRDGHVDFKSKWVRTDKVVRERRARRALVGKYRNHFTDDPAIGEALRSTANTNIVHMYGHLLALKEDGLPYDLDPHTLRTKGLFNFNGEYTAPTFTAHPKVDAITGETIIYGYETKGPATRDCKYFLFDKNGKKIEEYEFEAPRCLLMHDIGITPNYVIFQTYPLEANLDRIKRGGNHWVYDETLPTWIGLLPRRNPGAVGIKWFTWKPDHFCGHFSNAFEKDGIVYADFPVINGNVMSWFPDKNGKAPPRPYLKTFFARFKLDPKATDLALDDPENLLAMSGEFSRIDDRFQGLDYEWTFFAAINMSLGYDREGSHGRPFPGFNSVGRMNNKKKTLEYWFPGPCAGVGEPSFIPRSADAPEGDGWVVCMVNRFDTMLSDLVVLDTRDWSKPVALVKLPIRVRAGLHGNFVPHDVMHDPKSELVDYEWVPAQIGGPVAPEICGSNIPIQYRGATSATSGHLPDGGINGFSEQEAEEMRAKTKAETNGVNGSH